MIARIDEITVANEQAADALKNVERRLADMAVLIKNITTYQKTKPVYEAYKKAKNKEQFRAANVGGKLPSVAALQAEYAKLTEQKEALYADYGKLKKQVKEYETMKRNIDSFLKIDRGQAKKKEIITLSKSRRKR